MTTETRELRIPVAYLDRALANFAKLGEKAAKLGVPPATLEVGELVERIIKNEITGFVERVEAWYPVTVSLAPIKLAGWALVAALDHIEGGIIARVVPGADLPPAYREAAPDCDHCRVKRSRNQTYVLRHDDGHFVQVGSTCLHNFLGIDPVAFVGAGTYLRALAAWAEDEGWGGGYGDPRYALDWTLALTARVIEVEGWLSRSKARDLNKEYAATANSVEYFLTARYDNPHYESRVRPMLKSVTDTHKALAAEALAWVRAKAEEPGLNDYFHNLVVLTTGASFAPRYLGLVASLIPTYQREMGRLAERKLAKASVHVGTVGKRMPVDLTVYDVKFFEGDYGVRSLVLMHDEAGNRYKWWTGDSGLSRGERFTGKGTVKAHEVYESINWTVLTRVAVTAMVATEEVSA